MNQSDTSKAERSVRARTDLEQPHEPLRSYELRTSEDRYRDLAEQVIDGILVTDSSGRPVDANRAACDLLGYSLEELRTLGPEDMVTAAERPRLPGLFRLLSSGRRESASSTRGRDDRPLDHRSTSPPVVPGNRVLIDVWLLRE